jgi:pyruvate formate lyase activating enzyme
MLIEARYWKTIGDLVVCQLCPHICRLKMGETGICRTRRNEQGKLVTLAYGNPIALNIDPIEKKPLYHFYPGSNTFSFATQGCNLSCLNCQNYAISQSAPSVDDTHHLLPSELVKMAIDKHCHSISYTYTDPVVYFEYATDIAIKAKEAGLKNIIVSAGYILPKPLTEWSKVMDAANIDLKVFDDSISQKLNGIRLAPVLKTLIALKNAGVWLEITNLLIPRWTDDFETIEKMCRWLVENGFTDTPLHFSRFYPTYKLMDVPPTPLATIEKAYDIAKSAGLKFVYPGNVPGHETENTYCPSCNSKVIERQGYNLSGFHLKKGCCRFCGLSIPGRFEN